MSPRKDDRVQLVVLVPREVAVRLTTAARERYLSRNLLVTKALEDLLAHLIPLEDLTLTRPDPPSPPEPTPEPISPRW